MTPILKFSKGLTDMNPACAAGKPIRIVQITDFHLLTDPERTMMGINTEQSFLDALGLALRNHADIDLFLMTGDLTQEPTAAAYQRLRERLETLPIPCYCLPGNHDEAAMIREVFVDSNIRYRPQILLDGWQIICLDSTIPHEAGGFLAPDQLSLLEEKLGLHPDRHAIVSFHHSPLPTGAVWLDTMMLTNEAELFELIGRFPQVKGVVFGHIHQAVDVSQQDLRLLGCPSTCFQFKPDTVDFALDYLPQGYRWLELYPDGRIATDVVRLEAVPAGLDTAAGGY
jgi:Icc protein